MSIANFNMIVRGDAIFDLGFQYTDISGVPVDITGWTIRMVTVSNGTVLMDCSTTNNLIQITDGVNGMWKFNVSSTITDTYTFTEAPYKIYMNAPDEDRFVVAEGIVQYDKGLIP